MEPPHHIPYGIAMLAAVLDRSGYEVTVMDNNAFRLDIPLIAETLKDEAKKWGNYDLFGFGGLITTFEWQQKAIKALRASFPNIPIVMGGGCFSSMPEQMFYWIPEISVGVYGEGEETIIDLVKHYDTKERRFFALREVKGIYYTNDQFTEQANKPKKVWKTQDRPLIEDLDTLPYPAWNMIPVEEYFKWSPIPLSPDALSCKRRIDVISERGCPNNCTFCFHNGMGQHRVRFNSVKYVVEMIRKLRIRYAVDFISFLDENMLCNRERTMDLCNALEDAGLTDVIKWGCLGTVRDVDNILLAKMRRAGCTYISYGAESMNQQILNSMRKGITPEMIDKALHETAEAQINPIMTFILGYPGETVDSILDSVRFWAKYNIQCDPFLIQPYPSTDLFKEYEGKIAYDYEGDLQAWVKKLGDATEFTVNLSNFSTPELLGLKELAKEHNIRELEKFKKAYGNTYGNIVLLGGAQHGKRT
jgi:anaerobic magnesium-protoporphyrin IX monomethyl ester cyclase